jgi:hypothetical protein
MSPNLLSRTQDASFLNEVANDDAVRPWLGGEGALDLAGTVGNPANVALVNSHGGFVFICHEATSYELHTLFRPEGRGAGVLPAAEEAFRWLFVNTDCLEILTKVPAGNRAADLLARRAGFVPIFTRDAAWPDGSAVTYFALTVDAWRARDSALAPAGHDFHTLIETAKAAAGSALPTHPDDEAHDRAAGAAVLMTLAGNPEKAVWLYNRWARFAGYQTIEIVSASPVVIDVRDALVTVRGEELEVQSCR